MLGFIIIALCGHFVFSDMTSKTPAITTIKHTTIKAEITGSHSSVHTTKGTTLAKTTQHAISTEKPTTKQPTGDTTNKESTKQTTKGVNITTMAQTTKKSTLKPPITTVGPTHKLNVTTAPTNTTQEEPKNKGGSTGVALGFLFGIIGILVIAAAFVIISRLRK
ncbi:DgyrCDS263 [Dimorphilus gyrociliatus]|uniref:DgyrCDS263 n=1 Tax=Dimorphilus gyrociliatus TaxID=2664684 RepID=A0A7I8V5I8_9ANNE|nr:DgyrCDS263 [Dimorphilus gyrociliatus]